MVSLTGDTYAGRLFEIAIQSTAIVDCAKKYTGRTHRCADYMLTQCIENSIIIIIIGLMSDLTRPLAQPRTRVRGRYFHRSISSLQFVRFTRPGRLYLRIRARRIYLHHLPPLKQYHTGVRKWELMIANGYLRTRVSATTASVEYSDSCRALF